MVTYTTPTPALPTDWDYSSDRYYHEYWSHFKEKALQGEWARALNSKFNSNFGEATKDWTVEDYRNWAEASGLTESIKKGLPSDYQQWTNLLASDDVGGIQRVIGALVMDKKGHFTDEKYETSSSDIASVVEGMRSYGTQKDLVANLREKGGTDEEIQGILDSRDGSAEGFESLLNDIENLSGDEWNNYINENFADEDILPNGTFGEYEIPAKVTSVENATTPTETVNQQVTEAVVGDSSLDALRKEEGFREENGRYFVGDQEYAYDEENDQVVFVGGEKAGDRWTPEGSGMASQYDQLTEQEQQTIAQQQGIVDEIVGTDEIDPVTGERVTPGLVNEYGDFVDKTLTDIDADDNDFAGQINAELDRFLTGKDADGNNILDDEGNPIKGFLDYQTDLETAGTNLETDLTTLQGLYNQAYEGYEGDLDPLRQEIGRIRGRLGEVADQQMGVARDAGDESYYSRLSDLYYQDAKDQLDASAAGARETLNEAYANAGLDPSSPAFTAAMKDLAMSRAGAERQAQRQSILDSYGLGSQMLSNRTTALSGAGNALGNEMAGVQTEMGALDSLYGVKLQGLNQRQDMIGQIYNTKANNANVGMQGLNTILNTNLKGIDANQNQFNTKINLSNDLYKNKAGMYGTAYDALGGMRGIYDKEGGDRLNTLTEFGQDAKSDAFILESLQQQASQNPNYEVPQWIIDIYGGNK
jgi:hypothetical protein